MIFSGRAEVGEDAAPASSGWVVPAIPGDELFAGSVLDLGRTGCAGLGSSRSCSDSTRPSAALRRCASSSNSGPECFASGDLRSGGSAGAATSNWGIWLRAVIHGGARRIDPRGDRALSATRAGPDGEVNLSL